MDNIISMALILAGLGLRLAIPALITGLIVVYLHKLDERWQSEAEIGSVAAEKAQCWEIRNCLPEIRSKCEAASANLPCWQFKRLPNGYLRAECLDCEVFHKAPVPVVVETIEEIDHAFPL